MRKLIFIFVCVCACWACSKEDELIPSGKDKDWFVIEDDSDQPIDKAIYAFYQKWSVPVFYNDTIGFETEEAYGGEIDTLYRVLNINYTINSQGYGVANKHYSFVRDEEDLLAGVDFLDKYLFPNMPEVFHQTSVFLVDSLYEERYAGYPNLIFPSVYQGMETLVIGNIPGLRGLGEAELRDSANQILQYLTVSYLHSQNPDGIEDFYQVSSDLQTQRTYYEVDVRQPYYPGEYVLEPARWEEYGFLNYDQNSYAYVEGEMEYWSYTLPSQDADLNDYVMAVLNRTPKEFEREYASYAKVIEKFTLLRNILVRIGVLNE